MTKKCTIALLIIFMIGLSAPDLRSAEKIPGLIAIKGARIVPVVGAEIPKGTIVVRDGRIAAIGADVAVPEGAEVIDASGLIAFPGMIDPCTNLGLVEISNVAATADNTEIEAVNSQLRTVEAIRPDNMHIAIARSCGITAAHVVPSGQFIEGQSGVIRLYGRIAKDMIVKSPAFMRISFQVYPQYIKGEPDQSEGIIKQTAALKEILDNARLYQRNKLAAAKNPAQKLPEFDEGLEFLIPVVNGELPVMFDVETEAEIRAAIKITKEEKLKAVFFGVSEAWKMAGEIKEAGIPLILSTLYEMPSKWEDGYDAGYLAPSVLLKAGVTFAFGTNRYLPPFSIDLPYQAAKAVAFGMDKDEALKCVTIRPAEILGVADIMGSLEVGKAANIVLADGDILDRRTHIRKVFIDGKDMDLSNRYTELLEKFKNQD